jgi:hypothetical protein
MQPDDERERGHKKPLNEERKSGHGEVRKEQGHVIRDNSRVVIKREIRKEQPDKTKKK